MFFAFLFSKPISSSNRIKLSLMIIGPVAILATAWLVPNHYPPWVAAWGDGLAIFGFLFLLPSVAANSVVAGRISWQISIIAAASGIMLLAQFETGRLLFFGDVAMAALYVSLWLAAVLTGRYLAESTSRCDGVSALTTSWLFAALLSVGIALVQWTGALSLGIYAADLPPGARPFANLAQPNNFCTLCFLGLCGLLWLQQLRHVNSGVFWLASIYLLLGMVLSQSRTGWLQLGLLIMWGLVMRVRASLRITRLQLLVLGTAFVLGALLLPWISEALLLSGGRSLDDQMQAGMRLPYWRAMLDAIGSEPLWGYGWQQVGSAQQSVALDHPAIGDYFEHAHNLVLDLLLWNGVPVGGLIIVVLAWWFIAHIRACRDARVVWLLTAAGGVFVHGMLELPLEYAYFLIPVGLAMGAVDGLSPELLPSLRLPRWAVMSFSVLLSAVFVWTVVEYLEVEENYRTFRLEAAHIGVEGIVTPAPKLRLLTQLGAFLEFAHAEATPGMRPEQVDWMRKVSERFGYPSVLFRYALAAGLNGQPEVARETLARICRIHSRARCLEAREVWKTLQMRYPQLAEVTVPLDGKN